MSIFYRLVMRRSIEYSYEINEKCEASIELHFNEVARLSTSVAA